MSGRFIVFEGIDGSGKTSQINAVSAALTKLGRRVHITAEPTFSLTGGMLRDALSGLNKKTPCEMAAMFVLDRIYHNVNPINGIGKMLSDGYDVLCDRYYYSSLAYQGSETDFDWVKNANCSCPEIRRPDLCIFLDVDPCECLRRINGERTTREIYEKADKLEMFRKRYLDVFATLPDNVKIIDNSSDFNDTTAAIVKEINKIL